MRRTAKGVPAIDCSPHREINPYLIIDRLAEETFSGDAYLSVNKTILKKFGPEKAIFLGNLIDKRRYFRSKKMLKDGLWFFLTHESQMEQTGMSEKAIRRCKRAFIDTGIISVQKFGIPAKEFYKVDMFRLINQVGLDLPEREGLDLPEREGLLKENKDKENKAVKTASSTDATLTASMFEKFWKLYPRKLSKGKALTAWERLCRKPSKERPTWGAVKLALIQQRKTDQWKSKDFVPHPATWINQKRWLDDPAEMVDFKNQLTPLSTPSQSPAEIVNAHFKVEPRWEDATGGWDRAVLQPALTLTSGTDPVAVAQGICRMADHITASQHRPPEDPAQPRTDLHHKWDQIPDALSLLRGYVSWLPNQSWTTPGLHCFAPDSKVFRSYLVHVQKEIGFDIFSGRRTE